MPALIEVLEHNRGNDRDGDIWVIHENGRLEILPDQNIEPLQDPFTWPKYIGRAESINKIVKAKCAIAAKRKNGSAVDGLDNALASLNIVVGATIANPGASLVARAGAIAGRFISDLLVPPISPTEE